jgi:hypothetical protein
LKSRVLNLAHDVAANLCHVGSLERDRPVGGIEVVVTCDKRQAMSDRQGRDPNVVFRDHPALLVFFICKPQ